VTQFFKRLHFEAVEIPRQVGFSPPVADNHITLQTGVKQMSRAGIVEEGSILSFFSRQKTRR